MSNGNRVMVMEVAVRIETRIPLFTSFCGNCFFVKALFNKLRMTSVFGMVLHYGSFSTDIAALYHNIGTIFLGSVCLSNEKSWR